MKTKLKELLDGLVLLATSEELLNESRYDEKSFTRNRKLPFKKLLFFMLNTVNKSSEVALIKYFDTIGDDYCVTQQAFSKARNKINHIAFLKFFQSTTAVEFDKNKWNGYSLNAIDGSAIALPETKALRDYFGTVGAKNTSPTARASVRVDILADKICDAEITPYKIGERATAMKFLSRQNNNEAHINIYDRGYFAWDFAFSHKEHNIHFLFRLRTKFNKIIDSLPLGDHMQLFKVNGKDIIARIIKFTLESGEIETLITDVFDKNLSIDDFKQLYFKRWAVETTYDVIKNKLGLENFTGLSPNCIMQDFFATMTVANLAAAVKYDATQEIRDSRKHKDNKYTYSANINSIIGIMKDKFILYILFPNDDVGKNALKHILKYSKKCVVPIRPGRKFPRNRPRASKYHKNIKFNA
jgi:hypothetical protein